MRREINSYSTDCRLPIADCRLPIADCRLPIAFLAVDVVEAVC